MYTEIKRCRICSSEKLLDILSLGLQPQAGVFPLPNEKIAEGPLELVKCDDSQGTGCGLVQLRHSFHQESMFGNNYGYRSGLNRSMVNHLKSKVAYATAFANLQRGDVIVDVGSNDGTTLGFYPDSIYRLIGIDPTITKFETYYRSDIERYPTFFSDSVMNEVLGASKIKILTSISMFYDLEAPMDFVRTVKKNLAHDGIWIFEQSYLPTMLKTTSYDTICHEHLEYYHLKPILWMLDQCGLRVLDVELNDINGGSFSVTAGHVESVYEREKDDAITLLLRLETELELASTKPLIEFRERIEHHRHELRDKLTALKASGKKIFGYGASTKGNVLLNYCGINSDMIDCIAEVNQDKVGHVTPGTNIPIISEAEARALKPDVFLVMPWHFRDFFIEKESFFLRNGGKLLFPLPSVEEIPQ